MNINFNQEVIRKIRKEGITTNNTGSALYILFCMYEGRNDLLDEFDDSNKERHTMILYRQLLRRGMIRETEEDTDTMYHLTDKGQDIVEAVKQASDTIIDSETIAVVKEANNVNEWIKEYIHIFPVGMHHGRSLRTNSQDCIDRMKWFINKYGYTKDVILKATKMYVEGHNNNYEYMRNASYFIWKSDKEKGKISDLATACEQITDIQDEPKRINRELI